MSKKDLEKALENWWKRRANFERALAITADEEKKFSLEKEIEKCKENIEKLETQIEKLSLPIYKEPSKIKKLLVQVATGLAITVTFIGFFRIPPSYKGNYTSSRTRIDYTRYYIEPHVAGDKAIWVQNTKGECFGYWIKGKSGNKLHSFKLNVLVSLVDFFDIEAVFFANRHSIWEGSPTKFCELHWIQF
ncbi:MAG: hypothetical protein F6K10_17995 [Moorea sp. SIO2B7]|nr:hypothetical protein [Moorena sp. SIO2B7]